MNRILLICLLSFFTVSAWAQIPDNRPPNFAKWNGRNSDVVLNNPTVKKRLKRLLGKENYADFLESWETINPVTRKSGFLFSSGCLIHSCGHLESAIAIDLTHKTFHVGIFREGEPPRYYAEKSRKTPRVLQNWAQRLVSQNAK